MKILFDTHALLWFLEGNSQLPKKWRTFANSTSRSLAVDGDLKLVSLATYWELAIKISLGKLTLTRPFHTLAAEISGLGFEWMSIKHAHLHEVATLPLHHRDPFDRLLVTQARVEGMKILTADPALRLYSVDCVW